MKGKEKHPQIFFRMEEKLVNKLDKRIDRAGYPSRSEFFTAVAYVALYGAESLKQTHVVDETVDVEKLPETVTTWVCETMPKISEEEIQRGLRKVMWFNTRTQQTPTTPQLYIPENQK